MKIKRLISIVAGLIMFTQSLVAFGTEPLEIARFFALLFAIAIGMLLFISFLSGEG